MCRSDRIGGWEGDLDGERCDMRAGRSRSPMSYLSCSRLFSRPVHVRFRFGPVCVCDLDLRSIVRYRAYMY